MSPSRPFILRPVATSLLMAAILLVGIVGYTQLPVSALPEVDYPTIQVVTFYPGASPDVMATTVTAPLERQFGQLQGLSQMTSSSSGGNSVVVLQFNLSLNIDVAEEEVQSAINASQSFLPANLPAPPIYSKTNPADAPVLTLAITSKTIPLSQVEDLVDTRLAPKISQLTGVGLVSISGGQKPAVRIQANPTQLSSYGLNLEDLRTAVTTSSVNAAKGNFDGPRQDYQIDANDQLVTSKDYRQVVVAYRNGAPIMLTDVAQILDGVENATQAAWMNQTPAIILNVQRQPGGNTISVVKSIKKLLPQLEANLPRGIDVTTLTDLTTPIQASVDDVEFELLLTIGLVVMVIFLFLRNLYATIIPSVAVPLSLVGTFAAMYALGYSLDNLSLMALTISTGFVVDDAIVMVENISRYLEEGDPPMEAALKGAEQIGFTIVSLTVSLIAVLIPLLFMGDVVGRLFREFAVTLAVTIIISAIVSLTLTPMMASRILKHDPQAQQGRFYKASERVFEGMIAFYGRTLKVVLRFQTLTLLVALATLLLTIFLYIIIPKGFFPVQDTGVIQGITQAPQTIGSKGMAAKQQEIAKVILQDPAVESLSSFIGPDGTNTTINSGRMSINLKPLEDRDRNASDVIRRLQSKLGDVQGIQVFMQPVQNITVDDRVSRTQYQYTLEDPDQAELNDWTGRFVEKLKHLPEIEDVATDQQTGGLAVSLVIDRATASRLGIAPTTIDNTLYDAFGQRQVNTMYTQLNQYHVILEAEPQFQLDPDKLNHIYIQSNAASGTSGAAASSSSGRGSTSAGSNALTGAAVYTPSAGIFNPPANALTASTASTARGVTTAGTTASNISSRVPLSAFSHFETTTEPLTITHQGQFPAITVSFNLAPGAALGGAIDAITKVQKDLHMPASMQADFEGTAASFRNSLSNEPLLILAALVTVYIVLGVLYESFIHPITILSTLPSAGVGAFLSLILFHQDLSVVAIIGIVLLIGIVKKNGIMMVDFALEAERNHGKTSTEAIYEACLLRFRPIMMTTMAALLGGLPLAFGHGIGSELRRPLGISMVGGLLLSQVLTLYTTPVIYIFFDNLARRFSRKPSHPATGNEPVNAPADSHAAGPGPRMSISTPFIHRPVATTLLTVAIAIAGGIAFQVLPVSPLPQVDFPTISVNASLPGASAEIMASSVATPLERQFGHIAGVTEMTSASSLGSTGVTIQFDLSRNIDGAARDVEAAINAARTYLPANLPANPTYRKVNPADAPIMIIGLTSDKYGPDKLYDEASTVIQQKISQIQGVGQVNAGGGALPSVRVEVNPTKLASFGLTMANLQAVLSLQNSQLARGQITDGDRSADIVVNGQISHAVDYKPIIVGYSRGAAVRLEDVADVVDSTQNIRTAGYLNGKRAVTLIIFRQPGANIIDTVDRIRAQLPSVEASIPRGITTTIVLDRTTTIRASVSDVERTLLISIVLVIVVVFVFLRNGRATLIPAVAVPVSLIGTFAVMYLAGFSLDNLSLMALTISTGFVVDDAIVVMENITRHLEDGMDPLSATLRGAREIGFTVVSISISLIAVFIPLLLMGGIVGRLFREFAITLSTAILVSMVISLTTTPMMCAYLLKSEHNRTHGRLYNATERFFDWVLSIYRRSLHWVLENPGLTLVVLFLTIALNVVTIIKIPKGFFPQQDTGSLGGGLQGPQDSSFPAMNDSLQRIEAVINKDPAVQNVMGFTGGQGASNTGNMFVILKPLKVRKISAPEVINRLRPQLNKLPVASAFLQASQDLRIGGRGSSALYQYTLQADNVTDLQTWGPKLLAEMKKLPGLQDVNSDQQNGGLDERIVYDRVTAARLGQTVQSLDAGLYAAFGQSQVSLIYTQLNQYYVVLEFAPEYWQTPEGLKNIYFHPAGTSSTTASGNVPLFTMAKAQANTTPLALNHTGLFPSVTVSFNLAPGMALSDATLAINQMQQRMGTPSSIRGFFAGTLQAYQQSLGSEPVLIVTALLAVYIVLGILYESLVHPLTILSTLPSASVGAMLALILFHQDLNVISIIGIVLLIGIVKKNAIMMIDFALQAEREQHLSTEDAIFEACMLRFRPILMTTMAALFGALPLAFGNGTGSELRRPLGITIVGGLIVSQLLTLYTTPVVYLTLDRLRLRVQGKTRDDFHAGGPEPFPAD